MSLANGTITHWLYEDAAGSLRERMRSAAEIWLGAVATGEPCHEPLPDLFGAIERGEIETARNTLLLHISRTRIGLVQYGYLLEAEPVVRTSTF